MRVLTLLGLSVTLTLSLRLTGPIAAACEVVGEVQFICDVIGPEDLAIVPNGNHQSAWKLQRGFTSHRRLCNDLIELLWRQPERRGSVSNRPSEGPAA